MNHFVVLCMVQSRKQNKKQKNRKKNPLQIPVTWLQVSFNPWCGVISGGDRLPF